jgi:hypothetical protein
MKNQLKNQIFTDQSSGKRSYGSIPALTDVLFLPSDKDFSIDKMSSSIDIATTEDVEYFRDKAITATGLPKGYFLADGTTDRGNALASQDLKFARKLLPAQYAFVQGIIKLCTILSAYVSDKDPTTHKITVSIKKPENLSQEKLEQYQKINDTAVSMIDGWSKTKVTTKDAEGQDIPPKIPEDMHYNLLIKLGMPPEICLEFLDPESEKAKELRSKKIDPVYVRESTTTLPADIRLEIFEEAREFRKGLLTKRAEKQGVVDVRA